MKSILNEGFDQKSTKKKKAKQKPNPWLYYKSCVLWLTQLVLLQNIIHYGGWQKCDHVTNTDVLFRISYSLPFLSHSISLIARENYVTPKKKKNANEKWRTEQKKGGKRKIKKK